MTCPSGHFVAVQPKSFRLGPASSDRIRSSSIRIRIVTILIVSPLAATQPLDLVVYGRLATGVKKARLLCSSDERDGSVLYLSLEWLRWARYLALLCGQGRLEKVKKGKKGSVPKVSSVVTC